MIELFNIFKSYLLVILTGIPIILLISHKNQVIQKNQDGNMFLIAPAIGMAWLHNVFYFFDLLSHNSNLAFWSTVGSVAVFYVAVTLLLKTHLRRQILFNKLLLWIKNWRLHLLTSLICVIAAFPYIRIGAGNFFLSANQDIFNIIERGNYYLQQGSQHPFTIGREADYASNAFWTLLLNVDPLDAYIISSMLFLIVSVAALYWLSHHVFRLKKTLTTLFILFAILSNFYFSTHLASHRGSLYYGALLPATIGLLILIVQNRLSPRWMFIVILLAISCEMTFGGPLFFALLPIPVLWLIRFWHRKLPNYRIIIILCLVLFGVLLALGHDSVGRVFEELRIKWAHFELQLPWEISNKREMINIVWGLYPSPILGSNTAVPEMIENSEIYAIILTASVSLSCISIISGMYLLRSKFYLYIGLFHLFFIVYFYIMFFVLAAPYYFYKFLYTTLWLVLLGPFVVIDLYWQRLNRIKKGSIIILYLTIFSINMFWNINAIAEIMNRPFHKGATELNEIVNVARKFNIQSIDPQMFHDINMFWAVNYKLYQKKLSNYSIIRPPKYFITSGMYLENNIHLLHAEEGNLWFKKKNERLKNFYEGRYLILAENPEEARVEIVAMDWTNAPKIFAGYTIQHFSGFTSRLNKNIGRLIKDGLLFLRQQGISDKLLLVGMDDNLQILFEHHAHELKLTFAENLSHAEWLIRLTPNAREAYKDLLGVSDFQRKEIPSFQVIIKGLIERYTQNSVKWPDGITPIWQNDLFYIYKKSKNARQNITDALKIPQPLYDARIYVHRTNPEQKYLRLLVQPGPGINFAPFQLHLADEDGRFRQNFTIRYPGTVVTYTLPDWNVEKPVETYVISQDPAVIGVSLRRAMYEVINYSIRHLELVKSDTEYSSGMLKALYNPTLQVSSLSIREETVKKDIILDDIREQVQFGTGWFPFEGYHGSTFRWIGEMAAELIIHDVTAQSLVIELEPVAAPMRITAVCNGSILTEKEFNGRESWQVDIPAMLNQTEQNFLSLKLQSITSPNIHIPDPRGLRFRVFSIKLLPDHAFSEEALGIKPSSI